jgi:hypothetical protein
LLGIAVLVIIWSLTASRAPVEDASPSVPSFRAVMPLLFPTLFAQTQIAGCSNGNVNTGNEINITTTRVRGRRVATPVENGELVEFSTANNPINLVGAVGSVASVFLNNVPIQSSWFGDYNQLLVTLSSQMTYKGATQCTDAVATGGETRYYYSDGSTTSSPFVTSSFANANTLKSSTTVSFGGGEFPMPVDYEITLNGITMDVKIDPSIAVYSLGVNNVVFPSVNMTFGSVSQP